MATVMKKLLVALATEPKILKTIGGIILGMIIIICMPIAVVLGIFNGDIHVDTDGVSQVLEENMTDEEQEEIRHIDDTMYGIENQMIAKGYTQERVKEAQILYMLVLEEAAEKENFIENLIQCFAEDQTDDQLIENVNLTFGLQLCTEEFTTIMEDIRRENMDANENGGTQDETVKHYLSF